MAALMAFSVGVTDAPGASVPDAGVAVCPAGDDDTDQPTDAAFPPGAEIVGPAMDAPPTVPLLAPDVNVNAGAGAGAGGGGGEGAAIPAYRSTPEAMT